MEESVDSYPGLPEIVTEQTTEMCVSQISAEKLASDDLGSNVRKLRRFGRSWRESKEANKSSIGV